MASQYEQEYPPTEGTPEPLPMKLEPERSKAILVVETVKTMIVESQRFREQIE